MRFIIFFRDENGQLSYINQFFNDQIQAKQFTEQNGLVDVYIATEDEYRNYMDSVNRARAQQYQQAVSNPQSKVYARFDERQPEEELDNRMQETHRQRMTPNPFITPAKSPALFLRPKMAPFYVVGRKKTPR